MSRDLPPESWRVLAFLDSYPCWHPLVALRQTRLLEPGDADHGLSLLVERRLVDVWSDLDVVRINATGMDRLARRPTP
jgi:hypothetical protein